MRKLSYSMGVSLDGFIAGPGGNIDWSGPDEELHRFHNEKMRATGVQLMGRRLYETMSFWDTGGDDPADPEVMREFAAIWRATPRLVFSRTLGQVHGGAELVHEDIGATVARLKSEPGADIAVGGAELAAECIRLGLVDEYLLFVYPIVLGAGTPYFPPLEERIALRLTETRTFGSKVVHLRYERA